MEWFLVTMVLSIPLLLNIAAVVLWRGLSRGAAVIVLVILGAAFGASAAIALSPPDATLFAHLGNTLREAGELSEAQSALEAALRLAPQSADAHTGLGLVLAAGNVKSLVINFCGAFARTDVMADGVVKAWEKLKPAIPVFFSIHGTGEDEAVKLVRERLGIEPYDFMEDAVAAAVEAAR